MADAACVVMASETEEAKNRGRKRVRTKGIQKKLLEQIEFYFGDSNLQKDRFLQQKMKEHPDGYVSVETIAGFNKMKSLTSDISMVVQVIKRSELIELSSDEKWVRRSIPLSTSTDTDDRTIYVEHLPSNSNQESVRKLFKVFGNISYVSLPRHKPSGTIKGFSFIEFATVQEAETALEYFKSGTKPVTPTIKCKPNPDKTDERGEEGGEVERGEGDGVEGEVMEGGKAATGDGGGGGEVEKGEGDVKGEGEKTPTGVGEGEKAVTTEGERGDCVEKKGGTTGKKAVTELESGVEEAKDRKRKRGRDTSEGCPEVKDDATPLAKKSRSDEMGEKEEGERVSTVKPTTSEKEEIELPGEQGGERGGTVEPAESRKRKRTDETTQGGGEGSEPGSKAARVDTQSSGTAAVQAQSDGGGVSGEVRMLRLDSQTTEMSETGEQTGQKRGKKKRNRQHKKWDWEAAVKTLQLRVMAKKEWLEMREIFRSMQKEKVKEMKQQLREEGGGGGGRLEKGFVSQCLVHVAGVGMAEGDDVITREKIQEICSKYGAIAYTDIEEGASEGYIRYGKSGCVDNLVNAEEQLPHVKFTPVSDEDERAYYLKTVAARKQLSKTQRAKKKRNIRGQDKIISRALQHQSRQTSDANKPSSPLPEATHIRFSDSEHES